MKSFSRYQMEMTIKSIVLFLSIATAMTFTSCGSKTNSSTELESDVFLDGKSGIIVASEGGAILPYASNSICSYHSDSVCITFTKLPTSNGIGIQFFNFNGTPSDSFTIVFDNGKSVLVNQSAVKGDGRYMVAIGENSPIYSDLYEGLMNSKECSISDAYPNRVFVFRVGGFDKLIKYLK